MLTQRADRLVAFAKARPEVGALLLLTLAGVALPGHVIGGWKALTLPLFLLGVTQAAPLAMQAMGLVLVYRSNRIINFAQVSLGLFSGYLFWNLMAHREFIYLYGQFGGNVGGDSVLNASYGLQIMNFVLSFLAAFLVAPLVGFLAYFAVIRWFEKVPPLMVTVASIGLAYLIPTAVGYLDKGVKPWPSDHYTLQLPVDVILTVDGVRFNLPELAAVLFAVLAMIGIGLFLRFSAVGVVLRASADNTNRARTLGVSVATVISIAWVMAAVLAGLAAITTAASTGAQAAPAQFDPDTLVRILAVAVIARFASLPMAVAGAFGLGVIQEALKVNLSSDALFQGLLLLLIVAFLLVQRRARGRSDLGDERFAAAVEARPIPPELRRFPVVRRYLVVGGALVLLGLLIYPWLVPPGAANSATTGMVYAMVGLSLLVLTGWAGQISLGQFAFAAVGAWTTAILSGGHGVPMPFALLAGALAGATLAVLVGLPALRLPGLNLAVVTLALTLTATSLLLNPDYLGAGLPGTLDRPGILGLDSNDERVFYYFTLVILALAVVAVLGVRRSRVARALIASRDNEAAAQAFGISLLRARLQAFAFSGFLAAAAGGLFAFQQHGVHPPDFAATVGLQNFLVTVIGGLGTIVGPVIGQVAGLAIPQLGIAFLAALGIPILSLVLLLFQPGGLGGMVFKARDAVLRRIAVRYRVVVPSLLADYAGDRRRTRAPIAAKKRRGGGDVFVPFQYRLRRQWSIRRPPADDGGLQLAVVAAGAGPDGAAQNGHLERFHLPSAREVELGHAAAAPPRPALVVDAPAEVVQAPRHRLRARLRQVIAELNPFHVTRGHDPRPAIAFGTMDFVQQFQNQGLLVVLPNMLASLGGGAGALLALLGPLYSQGLNLGGPGIGYLGDRYRKRMFMVRLGASLSAVAGLLRGLAVTLPAFVSTQVGGAAGQVLNGPADAVAADYYPIDVRARVTFFRGKVSNAGAVAGYLVTGVLAAVVNWRWALVFLGLAGGVALVVAFMVKEPPKGMADRLAAGANQAAALEDQAPVGFAEAFRSLAGIRTLRRIWYAFPFAFATFVYLIFSATFFAQRWQMGPVGRGLLGAAGAIAGFAGLSAFTPVYTRLVADRLGRLLNLGALILVVESALFAILAFSPTELGSIVAFVGIGALYGVVARSISSVLQVVIPARVRATGLETVAITQIIGLVYISLLAPAIFNVVFSLLNVSIPPGAGQLVVLIPTALIAAYLVQSASRSVDDDIRTALAVSMAEQEAKRARAAGRRKMVICRDVDVEYDSARVLFHVNLDVEEGEILALLGTNGAGKSTLLRAIAGLQPARSGAVFLDGADVTHVPPHLNAKNGVVMLPGGHAVFPSLTVEENLRAAAWLYRQDHEYVKQRTEEILGWFPLLRARLHETAGNMSGGEQQMLALGQAFLMKPRLLMIDELSLGLAPAVVEQLLDIVRRINAQGTTVVVVEQSVNVALALAERAVFMEKGQVRFEGPTAELLDHREILRSVFLGQARGGGLVAAGGRVEVGVVGDHTPDDALVVQDLRLRFGGVNALNGVSLSVAEGEVVGIVGPNGAGKTTLFDAISGYVRTNAGSITLMGHEVTAAAPDARARLGLARSFQNVRLFPALTVRENITVALERNLASRSMVAAALWLPLHRTSERRAQRRVESLIESLGLEAYANKFMNELSTGTRRVVDIACVLASAPKVLLLDEPTSGLAQAETEELGPFIGRISKETGCAVLVIEHDLSLVAAVSDRLVAMRLGEVMREGRPHDVLRDDEVAAALIGEANAALNRSGELARGPALREALIGH